jgi:hypothetical protein
MAAFSHIKSFGFLGLNTSRGAAIGDIRQYFQEAMAANSFRSWSGNSLGASLDFLAGSTSIYNRPDTGLSFIPSYCLA